MLTLPTEKQLLRRIELIWRMIYWIIFAVALYFLVFKITVYSNLIFFSAVVILALIKLLIYVINKKIDQ